MKADQKEIFCLKALLNTYAMCTGLKINFHKSSMIPINTDSTKMEVLAGTLPFTYLGLPLVTTKPKVSDFAPLIDRVERRLPSTTIFLNYGQRLTMVNSVLFSLPTYYMCTLKLPKKVILHIDRARRHCLWRKNNELETRTHSLAAWDIVCKPKKKGGLGIINLEIQNTALLMKHLHKFFNNRDLPWVQLIWNKYYINSDKPPHAHKEKGSFWWKDIFRLIPMFRALSSVTVGSGDSVLFWKDNWNNQLLENEFPVLFSYGKEEDISLHNFMESELQHNFHLPLSNQAMQEWDALHSRLQNLHFSSEADKWAYMWKTDQFQPRKVY